MTAQKYSAEMYDKISAFYLFPLKNSIFVIRITNKNEKMKK